MSTYNLLKAATGENCRNFIKFGGGDHDYAIQDGRVRGSYLLLKSMSLDELNRNNIFIPDNITLEDIYAFLLTEVFMPVMQTFFEESIVFFMSPKKLWLFQNRYEKNNCKLIWNNFRRGLWFFFYSTK